VKIKNPDNLMFCTTEFSKGTVSSKPFELANRSPVKVNARFAVGKRPIQIVVYTGIYGLSLTSNTIRYWIT